MATRNMETTLISARDLNNAGMFAKTKAYAVAWISTDLKNRLWTPVDEENGTNPTWNQVMNFTLDEAALQQGRLLLEVEIYNDSTFGEKEIGRVSISLKEFLKPADNNKVASDSAQFVSYQVRKPNGKPKGSLNLSVRLAEKVDFKPQQQSREAEKVDFKPQQQSREAEKVDFKPQQQSREVVTESYEAVKEPVVADPVYESVVSSPPATNQYPPQSYAPQAEYDQPPPPPHHQGYPPPPPHHSGYPPPPPPPHHSGYPPPPPPPHHRGYPPPPPHHPGYPPPPPPPHHPGYPLY